MGSLFFFILATKISFLFVSLITFCASLRSVEIRDYDPRFINLKSFKQIITLSGASFAITLSIALLFQGSVILVTYSIGLEATAIFALVILIYRSATPFFQIFPTLLNPIAAERSNLTNDQYMENFFVLSISYGDSGWIFNNLCIFLF